MLSVQNLVFDYPAHRALDDVSFAIEAGTITALVGPNGAGKSTLMRVCAALDQPFSGRVLLAGQDIHERPRHAHRRMGFLPDFYGLYDDLTVAQCLAYRAASQGVAMDRRASLVAEAAARLEIDDRMEQKAGTLSRGLRQRLAIAQAVLHDPSFLMLDEPAAGLDPSARIGLSAVLRKLAAEGMTILVSSHILAELQDYSTHILMLRQGRVVEHAPLNTISTLGADDRVEIRLDFAAPIPGLEARLGGVAGIEIVSCGLDQATVLASADAGARAATLAGLVAAGLPLAAFAPERRNLQDIYLKRMKQSDDAPLALPSGGGGATAP
ncbi:MAG: ABC transporter ATP-binding protein [Rhodospirillaceae bacterium]|nr:ABC transporter ATP-binding protein [Rhodospirillaceae bacterium]